MKLELPFRLSATGMIGLAVLSATHWLRENTSVPAPAFSFVLGIMPNLAAAFAMPLILASFSPHTSRKPITKSSRHRYSRVLLFTTLGLCGWELIQTRSNRFVFDVYDILATGFGSALAYFAFCWHARTFEVKEQETIRRGGA
jgi:glycopeptide antibiotics resistance protein